MGSSIGGITGPLAALRSSPDFGQPRLRGRGDPATPPAAQTDDGTSESFFREERAPAPRVGLGQGLSTQGAALTTLNATIEGTRRTIPTFQEIRTRFIAASSARRDEAQRVTIERTERSLTRRVESRIPEASPQVRNFTSGLEEAVGQTQARFETSQAEAPVAPQASVETQAPAAPQASAETQAPAAPQTSVETQAPAAPQASVETQAPAAPQAPAETTAAPEAAPAVDFQAAATPAPQTETQQPEFTPSENGARLDVSV